MACVTECGKERECRKTESVSMTNGAKWEVRSTEGGKGGVWCNGVGGGGWGVGWGVG